MNASIAHLDALAKKAALRGLEAAARHLEFAIRDRTLAVQAPLVRVGNRVRAARRATPGAPPRMVSGRMRAATMRAPGPNGSWRVGVWLVPYARRHEFTGHPWLVPTFYRELPAMEALAGSAIGGTFA